MSIATTAATAFELDEAHEEAYGPARPGLSPALEETILEIAASERALDELLHRSDRLHQSNIQHDPASCLVCFGAR